MIYDYDADGYDVASVAITAEGNEFWIAVEYQDPGDPDPALELFYQDTVGGDFDQSQSLSVGRLQAGTTGMFPSIAVDAENVFVIGKEDNGGTDKPHLEFMWLDRDDMTDAVSREDVVISPTPTEFHGRHHLIADSNGDLYVCWQSHETLPGSDRNHDLFSSRKDGDTADSWDPHSDPQDIETSTKRDSHCMQALTGSNERLTAYHSRKGTGSNDKIYVKIDKFDTDTSTWEDIDDLELPFPSGHAKANFPTISIETNGTWDALIAAKSKTDSRDLLTWACLDASSTDDCNDADSEWRRSAVTPPSGSVDMPKALVADGNLLVFYEDPTDDTLRLFSKCGGTGPWTLVGSLARADDHERHPAVWGKAATEPPQSVAYGVDGDSKRLHAVYLARKDGGFYRNAIHWTMELDEVCPP